MKQSDPKTRRMAPLKTPTGLGSQATKDLPAAPGAASPPVGRPLVLAAAALLVFHTPRHRLFTRPAA